MDRGHTQSKSHHSSRIHTYGLGQRECDLQTLPLSRRRKMGQNNRNRFRCFQVSFQLSQMTCCAAPKGDRSKPQKVTLSSVKCMVVSTDSCFMTFRCSDFKCMDSMGWRRVSVLYMWSGHAPRLKWLDVYTHAHTNQMQPECTHHAHSCPISPC